MEGFVKCEDARSLSQQTQEAIRIQTVRAVRGGMTQVKAAEVFGVTRQAVGKWVKAERERGERSLKAGKRGRPAGATRLKGHQAATIVNLIKDRHPEQLKLPFALWTSRSVQSLIRSRFGIRLSARSVRRYLRRWGLTPQKPCRRAYEQNPESVRRWLEEEYPGVRAEGRRERAAIWWGDEMGFRSDHQAGRSYAPRGRTPVIPGTGQRFGCNVISAITNRGHLGFMVFKRRFTARVFLAFLRRLIRETGRKVYFIVDRHPVHVSGAVRRWLEAHASQIRLIYLPPYSPELNPDELLNNDTKANALSRRRPRTQRELMRATRTHLARRRRDPEMVKRFFHGKHVAYAAR
jgi:transposase